MGRPVYGAEGEGAWHTGLEKFPRTSEADQQDEKNEEIFQQEIWSARDQPPLCV